MKRDSNPPTPTLYLSQTSASKRDKNASPSWCCCSYFSAGIVSFSIVRSDQLARLNLLSREANKRSPLWSSITAAICNHHRYLVLHIEGVMCETFLRPVSMYQPKMGIVKARQLGVRSKIFLFFKMVQDYGNRSAAMCLFMRQLGQYNKAYQA